jgi:hypothetical protein
VSAPYAEACRCTAHEESACQAAITQEDLRCDACREGGCWLLYFNDVVQQEHLPRSEIGNWLGAFGVEP